MILAALDTETTGLSPADDRIIEVYVELIRGSTSIFTYEQRIDPQRSISAEAQRVHKISTSDLLGKPVFASVAPVLHKVLSKADGYLIHNAEFDIGMLKAEFKRNGFTLPEKPIIDTMIEGSWATPDGKRPNLKELCFACGIGYDETLAHAASYDVQRMVECYVRGSEWGFYPSEIKQDSLIAA